jgi:hypothetical protein
LGLSKSAGYLWGAPFGADGRATTKGVRGLRTWSLEALGKVDIMLVMSSEGREGFWRAGCRYLQPACQKATADNGALSAVPSAATLPKASSGRPQTTDTPCGPHNRRAGDQIGPILFQGGWVGIKIRRGRPRRQRRTGAGFAAGRSPRRRTHRFLFRVRADGYQDLVGWVYLICLPAAGLFDR